MSQSGFFVIEKIAVEKLEGAAKPSHTSVPTNAPRPRVYGGEGLLMKASTYAVSSPQRNAIRKRNGIPLPAPSFIFSSGISIKRIHGFLKSSEYQRPPRRKMTTPPTRTAR